MRIGSSAKRFPREFIVWAIGSCSDLYPDAFWKFRRKVSPREVILNDRQRARSLDTADFDTGGVILKDRHLSRPSDTAGFELVAW